MWKKRDKGVSERLKAVSDVGFRARANHEYEIVRRIVGNRISWDDSSIVDFGCGQGIAVASFALRHPNAKICGVDIIEADIEGLRSLYSTHVGIDLPVNLKLHRMIPGSLPDAIESVDLFYAWSVFEHVSFRELNSTIKLIASRLKTNGYFFLQINPLYFSPNGAHLSRYTPEPWSHLLHQTDVLRTIVLGSDVAHATKAREWEQYETLNRATADDIVEAVRESGLNILFEERLTVENKIPLRLSRTHQTDILVTEEIRLLMGK